MSERRTATEFDAASVAGDAPKDRRKSPEFAEAARRRAAEYWTPERRAAQASATKARMADPIVRAKVSTRTREAFSDPTVREKHAAGIRAAVAGPAFAAAVSAGTKAGMARWRAERLAALQDAWAHADMATRRAFLAEVTGTGRASRGA